MRVYEKAELEIIDGAGHGFYWGEPFARSVDRTAEFLKAGDGEPG